jgi:hypothetical protein
MVNACPILKNKLSEGKRTYTNTWANIVELVYSDNTYSASTTEQTDDRQLITNKEQTQQVTTRHSRYQQDTTGTNKTQQYQQDAKTGTHIYIYHNKKRGQTDRTRL